MQKEKKVKTELIAIWITPEMKQRMVIATRDRSVREGRMVSLSELTRTAIEQSLDAK
jgi:hypothetical protein